VTIDQNVRLVNAISLSTVKHISLLLECAEFSDTRSNTATFMNDLFDKVDNQLVVDLCQKYQILLPRVMLLTYFIVFCFCLYFQLVYSCYN